MITSTTTTNLKMRLSDNAHALSGFGDSTIADFDRDHSVDNFIE
jgi:hypothetical protein